MENRNSARTRQNRHSDVGNGPNLRNRNPAVGHKAGVFTAIADFLGKGARTPNPKRYADASERQPTLFDATTPAASTSHTEQCPTLRNGHSRRETMSENDTDAKTR